MDLPKKQRAVQLVGQEKLMFNDSKEVPYPKANQVVCKVEAVGLCFSDLKLLKQFSGHVRKSEIISGVDQNVLEDLSSYKPGNEPTVPGHEAVVRIAAKGDGIEDIQIGQRFLVQADYRWLKTENSNGAFGYNLEGGLQEYVLMDTKLVTSPEGESMLLPVNNDLSASSVALVEPWACVEDAYVSRERTTLDEDGKLLVVADETIPENVLGYLFNKYDEPDDVTLVSKDETPKELVDAEKLDNLSEVTDADYSDIIYFGSNADTAEMLFDKVAKNGLYNIVLCGGKFDRKIETAVGRVHYGGIRLIGTTGWDPSEAMAYIPKTDELREGDKVSVVGAGGPMGLMHAVRSVCSGIDGVSVYASDLDDERLAALNKIAEPFAQKNGVEFVTYNPKTSGIETKFDYISLMAPVPALVSQAVIDADKKGIVNIFAGIPAGVNASIDMNQYIQKQVYFVGTSGSVLDDMKKVLAKVQSGQLDTNVSVAAVCGLEDAIKGIKAVEEHSIAGKILVYPDCKDLKLTTLEDMEKHLPEVAGKLENGLWNKKAEEALLQTCKQ